MRLGKSARSVLSPQSGLRGECRPRAGDAEAKRFSEVKPSDVLAAVKIGKGAGDLEHSVIPAGGEPHRLGGVAQQTQCCGIGLSDLVQLSRRTLRIGDDFRRAWGQEALPLEIAGRSHSLGDGTTGFRRTRLDQVDYGDCWHLQPDVDPVKKRSGKPRLIVGSATGASGAAMARFTGEAAATGVHRGHQLEPGRVGDAIIGEGDSDLAGFERLP